MGVLSIFEVSKKQHYIFKSNRLKENIGASEIIRVATEDTSAEFCSKNNGKIINMGGGQTIFYFNNFSDSKLFAEELSFELIRSYPSLEFFITAVEYNPDTDSIVKKIRELHKKLEKKKAERMHYACIIDFGITQECDSTRLPAVIMKNDDEDGELYYSSEVKSKIDMCSKMSGRSVYALDFTDLGISKYEKSYIAITHIDGNRMGKNLKRLREKYEKSYTQENIREINEKYIKELQEFSIQVKKAFEKAFQKILDTLRFNMEYLREVGMSIKEDVLPIRKVILSGDDVCYITDARIALDCAYIFLKELEKYSVMGEKITACAGIAMVREKYPFFKTYELSEELCRNAKSSISEDANESRLDWHIVQGEYNNNLNEIRNTAYRTYDCKNLLLRPLVISEDSEAINSYANFRKDMQILNSGKIPRSKIKGMLSEMKKGEEHLDTYIEINNLHTLLGSHRIGAKTGFIGDKCVLFDAVETMDYYIPLCFEEE